MRLAPDPMRMAFRASTPQNHSVSDIGAVRPSQMPRSTSSSAQVSMGSSSAVNRSTECLEHVPSNHKPPDYFPQPHLSPPSHSCAPALTRPLHHRPHHFAALCGTRVAFEAEAGIIASDATNDRPLGEHAADLRRGVNCGDWSQVRHGTKSVPKTGSRDDLSTAHDLGGGLPLPDGDGGDR
jgi:hypothetical protein